MGKCCDRTVHLAGCFATLFAVLSSISYLVLQGLRERTLLNLDEYNEVYREWDTVPYVSVAIVPSKEPCPPTHPSLMLYDSWPGLQLVCYCEPSAEYDTGYNTSCDGASSKCSEREAIPNMYYGAINGHKICGARGGRAFKNAQRPQDNGSGILECPTDTLPCDDNVFTNTTVTVDQVLADPGHAANFVICAQEQKNCPITSIDINYDWTSEKFSIRTKKRATNLPLINFKLS